MVVRMKTYPSKPVRFREFVSSFVSLLVTQIVAGTSFKQRSPLHTHLFLSLRRSNTQAKLRNWMSGTRRADGFITQSKGSIGPQLASAAGEWG
ncbi:hypothetical protein IG631_04695 [Alternaria alternata]|nr:hypothetical protein IG631_04695 [Alternaria alternata]